MNKITLALVLGTGLTLSLVAPRAHAAPTSTNTTTTIQTLNTQDIAPDTFNSLFQQYNTAVLSPFRFDGSTSDSGLIESQVFQGTGKAQGLFAYAYQVAVNPVSDSGGEPVHVDSSSFKFNDTPMGTDLNNTGTTAHGYFVKSGQIGGLNLSGTQTPTRSRGSRARRPGSSGRSTSTRSRRPVR